MGPATPNITRNLKTVPGAGAQTRARAAFRMAEQTWQRMTMPQQTWPGMVIEYTIRLKNTRTIISSSTTSIEMTSSRF